MHHSHDVSEASKHSLGFPQHKQPHHMVVTGNIHTTLILSNVREWKEGRAREAKKKGGEGLFCSAICNTFNRSFYMWDSPCSRALFSGNPTDCDFSVAPSNGITFLDWWARTRHFLFWRKLGLGVGLSLLIALPYGNTIIYFFLIVNRSRPGIRLHGKGSKGRVTSYAVFRIFP